MQSAFESWVGQHVLVRLNLGKIKVSLRGILLKDRTETLLMGAEFGSELEIPKKVILAIEELRVAHLPALLAPFGRSARSARIKNPNSKCQVGWTNPFNVSLGFQDRYAPLLATFSTDFHVDRKDRKPLA